VPPRCPRSCSTFLTGCTAKARPLDRDTIDGWRLSKIVNWQKAVSESVTPPSVHAPHGAFHEATITSFFRDNSFQDCPLLDSNPIASQPTLIASRKTNLCYCIFESCNGAQEVEGQATNSTVAWTSAPVRQRTYARF
jgi:hypothetical protein